MARRRPRVVLALLVVFALPALASATDFYVSPAGNPSGDGSIGNPWDLQTALNQPSAVQPGDTVWLRAGTYVGTFTSNLTGTSAFPIKVRQYPGERATLDLYATTTLAVAMDTSTTSCTLAAGIFVAGTTIRIDSEQINLWVRTGSNTYTVTRGWNGTPISSHSAGAPVVTNTTGLTIHGAYTWFMDFELMSSSGQRTNPNPNSIPPDTLGLGIDVYGPGTKVINMIIHDTAQGIGFWQQATNAEVYGNLIYYNGWDAPDRGHGHGIYVQNQIPSVKDIADNILLDGFAVGIHAYTEGGYLDNIKLQGNTLFNNGALSLITGFTDNILVGGINRPANNPTWISNYTYTPFLAGGNNNLGYMAGCTNAGVTGNYFAAADALTIFNCTGLSMTGNTFYGSISGFTDSEYPNNTYYSTRPTGVQVFLRPNTYEAGRANVTIYNWDLLSTVRVDLSGILYLGSTYEIRNAQDFFAAPALSGIYDGNPVITIPMTGLTIAIPVGWTAPPPTGPEFNAFMLITTTLGPYNFYDVPPSSPYYPFVYLIAKNGITAGCGTGYFCPNDPVTRAQMAVFLLRGEHGSAYAPPACTPPGAFGDVPCPSGFAVNWIEQLHNEGITGGCGGGNYCPNDAATRAQMAVFLLKSEHGSSYVPPACTPPGIFSDVACPGAFAVDWIEQLYREGITGGCGGGNYCPNASITRAQMAVFLVRTFQLQ
jgi:hypothetical protein